MKYFGGFLTICYLLQMSFAQTPEPFEPETTSTCLQGTMYNGTVFNMTEVSCDLGNGYQCETKIVRNGFDEDSYVYKVDRMCKEIEPCQNSLKNNAEQCDSELVDFNGLRLCYYCCDDRSNCNDFEDFP
ncbi:unnamed protein product [Clavelina lepadiformis]|uniref:Secreted protein n=1 Tax=Clavelina lepadiformis TaxID=159417 RepID=A0ABP0GLB3_CLALP